jgi:hypothetical protein
MKTEDVQKIVNQMYNCFISPNVSDANFEAANLVDVVHDVANALLQIAKAINGLAEAVRDSGNVPDQTDNVILEILPIKPTNNKEDSK